MPGRLFDLLSVLAHCCSTERVVMGGLNDTDNGDVFNSETCSIRWRF